MAFSRALSSNSSRIPSSLSRRNNRQTATCRPKRVWTAELRKVRQISPAWRGRFGVHWPICQKCTQYIGDGSVSRQIHREQAVQMPPTKPFLPKLPHLNTGLAAVPGLSLPVVKVRLSHSTERFAHRLTPRYRKPNASGHFLRRLVIPSPGHCSLGLTDQRAFAGIRFGKLELQQGRE